MDRGKERSRWRRQRRRTDPSAPSASAPSTTSPSPSSPDDRLRRRGRKGRRGAPPSRHPRGNRRRTRVPPSIADGGRKPEAEGGRRWSAYFRRPLSLLIKERSGTAAAPLLQ